MITKRRLLVLGLISVFATFTNLVLPVSAQMIEIEHGQGSSSVPKNPQKVVVFDLASLDNMTKLGVESAVVALPESPLPDYLEKFGDAKYEKVGTLFEPDFEAVAALTPDLIIVGGRSQAKYADLVKIAPTIDLTVDNAHYFESVARNVTILGNLFDKKAQAEQEIATLTQDVEKLKTITAGKGRGLLILTTGGKMSAYGPGSRFGILYTDFGVTAAREDLSTGNHGEPISFEFILETNPDWLFVIDRDAAIGRGEGAAQALLDNPVVNKTIAAEKGRIVYLNPQDWYLMGGSLSGLHQAIDQVTAAYGK